ncbi:MAG: hypothetical protein GWP10_22380, partial [Nitrospiraceae bacterium]|nr:hypothetical protein [Nitrospiraceae bacterium]
QSLQHSLVNQGFKIEQVQVSLQAQSDPFQQGQSFQNHQQQQQGLFGQKENGEGYSESGNLFNQPNEKQQPVGHNRRFGYNSVEYVA